MAFLLPVKKFKELLEEKQTVGLKPRKTTGTTGKKG